MHTRLRTLQTANNCVDYIYAPQLEGVWGKEGKVPQSKTKIQRQLKKQWPKRDSFVRDSTSVDKLAFSLLKY